MYIAHKGCQRNLSVEIKPQIHFILLKEYMAKGSESQRCQRLGM